MDDTARRNTDEEQDQDKGQDEDQEALQEAHPTRRALLLLLQLVALCAFAVAQPILDVFGKSPETFLFRGADNTEIIAFALVVALVPPLALWGVALLSRFFGSHVQSVVVAIIVGGLVALIAMNVGKKAVGIHGVPLVVFAVVVGVLAALLYGRTEVFRTFLEFAAIAPVVFVGLFLFSSPVSHLLGAGGSSGAASIGTSTAPVVVVYLDELPTGSLIDRTGAINRKLFPNFAALADSSTWYRNFTADELFTEQALPASVTGDFVTDRQKVPQWKDFPNNLFSLLGSSHEMHVEEAVSQLCAPSLCPTTGGASEGGFSALLDDASSTWRTIVSPNDKQTNIAATFTEETSESESASKFTDAQVFHNRRRDPSNQPKRLQTFLSGLHRSNRPTLSFLHLLLPHQPWRFFPDGVQYAAEGEDPPSGADNFWQWRSDPSPIELTRRRHLMQVQYVDRLLGEVISKLKRIGEYDKSLVVVTGDAGEVNFQPGQLIRGVSQQNLADVMWTPLFIKAPGQQVGKVDDINTQQVDLLPTMAAMLHVKIPWHTDGSSVLGDPRRGPEKSVKIYANPPFQPKPTRTFRIDTAQGLAQIRSEAFAPLDPNDPPGSWLIHGGPEPQLIGQPVARVTQSFGLSAVLRDRGAFANVKDPTTSVPAYVAGSLEGVRANDHPLVVVAANGKIAGVSTTFDDRGVANSFAALVPDTYFKKGANELGIYVLRTNGAGWALEPVSHQ